MIYQANRNQKSEAPQIADQAASSSTGQTGAKMSESDPAKMEEDLQLGLPRAPTCPGSVDLARFDTRGMDGTLGPRSRETIGAWQKAQGQPATGHLTQPQASALLRAAPSAASANVPAALPASTASRAGALDGVYAGGLSTSGTSEAPGVVTAKCRWLGEVSPAASPIPDAA